MVEKSVADPNDFRPALDPAAYEFRTNILQTTFALKWPEKFAFELKKVDFLCTLTETGNIMTRTQCW
jgi:hypothetical protein